MTVSVGLQTRRFQRRALGVADAGRGCGRYIQGPGAIVAADPAGGITVGWTASVGAALRVRAADLHGTHVGPVQTLSTPGRSAVIGALAAGPGNSRLAVWTEQEPGSPAADTFGPMAAAVRGSAASTWTGPEAISPGPAFPGFAPAAVDPVTGRPIVLVPTVQGGLTVAIREPIG